MTDINILTERELTALEQSSGDDCDMAAVRCVVQEVRRLRAELERLQPICSVLSDWDWRGIVEDGCVEDDAFQQAAKALAYIEGEIEKERGNVD